MYTVLMPVGGNVDRTLAQTKTVASLPAATSNIEAVILHVFDEEATTQDGMFDPRNVVSVVRCEERLEEEGIDVSIRTEQGNVVEMVTQVAAEIDADCVAIGGPKRSPTGKAIFGSTSQQLILNVDRPVLVTISDPATPL